MLSSSGFGAARLKASGAHPVQIVLLLAVSSILLSSCGAGQNDDASVVANVAVTMCPPGNDGKCLTLPVPEARVIVTGGSTELASATTDSKGEARLSVADDYNGPVTVTAESPAFSRRLSADTTLGVDGVVSVSLVDPEAIRR